MNTLELKLKTLIKENDELQAEIDSLLIRQGEVRVGVVNKAMRTKTVCVDQISIDSLRKLLDAGYKVTISK